VVSHAHAHLGVIENTHDDGAGTVGPLVLGKVITAGKFLAAVGALKWLLMRVKRAIVTLQVFLATETTGAECADKGLGWVFGQ